MKRNMKNGITMLLIFLTIGGIILTINIAKNNSTNENQEQQKEEAIASFSTKIYNKDAARQNNIEITCSALNNTTVKNGEIFSFCNTIGPATSSKGYKEADIFDKNR